MEEKDIKEIIELYKGGSGIEPICKQFHVGKLKIKEILKANNVELKKKGKQPLNCEFVIPDYHTKKYVPTDGKTFVAISKIDGSVFKDYENLGGYLTSHIRNELNIEIPTLYDRRMYYMKTGNYWYEQWFDIVEKEIDCPTFKCPYCDWTTVDVDNKSGAFEVHLLKAHNITKIQFLKEHSEFKDYFKLVSASNNLQMSDDENEFVVCAICNRKLARIDVKHLSMHGITKEEYIEKYGANLVSANLHNTLSKNAILTNSTHPFKCKISKEEKEIITFIKDCGFDCRSNRSILNGREIDIYIPDLKIGIEYNGILWHCERFGKDKNYHLNKTNECKQNGIRLIHIFEDEYILHKDIVLTKLKHLLNVNTDLPKIAGRKCVIKEINKKTCEAFLEKYHIQGFVSSTIYLGAYYNNKLVAVMSFLDENDNKWNLTRFASDYHYVLQGVGGKLFNYFTKNYNPMEIKSFSDRRWCIDERNNFYIKLGFKFRGYTYPEYRYYNSKIDKYKRFHKFGFRKDVLHKKYGLPLTMTEREMTKELGYDRIWDCGLIKYVWKNDK